MKFTDKNMLVISCKLVLILKLWNHGEKIVLPEIWLHTKTFLL